MSTEYTILKDHPNRWQPYRPLGIVLQEHSCFVDLSILVGEHVHSSVCNLTDKELRTMILRSIEVLSYISDDSEAVMRRFNVNYGDKE